MNTFKLERKACARQQEGLFSACLMGLFRGSRTFWNIVGWSSVNIWNKKKSFSMLPLNQLCHNSINVSLKAFVFLLISVMEIGPPYLCIYAVHTWGSFSSVAGGGRGVKNSFYIASEKKKCMPNHMFHFVCICVKHLCSTTRSIRCGSGMSFY